MKTSTLWKKILYLLAVFVAALSPAARADSGFGLSNITTVDTTGAGSLSVQGRVLDRHLILPLASARVALAGESTLTDTSGKFYFANVNLFNGSLLSVNAAGYLPNTRTLSAGSSVRMLTVPDVLLSAPSAKPVFNSVGPVVDGIWPAGFGLSLTVAASVNWQNAASGSVAFYANGNLITTVFGSGPSYTGTLNIDSSFTPSLVSKANSVTVIATDATGQQSDPFSFHVSVIPTPSSLLSLIANNINVETGIISMSVTVPGSNSPIGKTVSLPVVGTFGGNVQASGEFDYHISTGEWEFKIDGGAGDPTHGASLLFGGTGFDILIGGDVTGVASPSKGIKLDTAVITASLDYSHEFDFSLPLTAALGPEMAVISEIPWLEDYLNPISIVLTITPSFEGELDLGLFPNVGVKDLALSGSLNVTIGPKASVLGADVSVFAGGGGGVDCQVPGDFLKDAKFNIYAGVKADLWWATLGPFQYVFLSYTYPNVAASLNPSMVPAMRDSGYGYVISGKANDTVNWKPMDRSFRLAGPEVFLGPVSMTSLGMRAAAVPLLSAQASASSGTAPLIQNVFPNSNPALAASGSTLMMLYVRDTASTNPAQFTEIAYSRFDGLAWSAPASLASDPRGQFSPKVAFDGNGNAIAVWEQIKDAGFSGTDIASTAAEMEIFWSVWNHVTQTWSPAAMLTNNAFLDHNAQLAGPMANGDLILTWIRNQGNGLMGSGTAGDINNDQVMTARWSCASGTWGAVSTFVSNLSADLSHSLAGSGSTAVYVWSQNVTGNVSDPTGTELFSRVWNQGLGSWGAVTPYTSDTLGNVTPHAAVSETGGIYVAWQRGNDIVMDTNLANAPALLHANAASAGFADFALTVGPAGNAAAVWEAKLGGGAAACYNVFDPVSGTWSGDAYLSGSGGVANAFAPAWDSSGNLVVAYDNVQMIPTTVNVPVTGGTIAITGVPQPGEVDLFVTRHTFGIDLCLPANSVTASGSNFLPGDTVTFTANVLNDGDLPVQNVPVGFYDGDPAASGTLIGTGTISGWLKAGDTQPATLQWTVPQPAVAHTLFVLVDPVNTIAETDKTNNEQSLALNGVDLSVSLLSQSSQADGSGRVIATVSNQGAPASPMTQLAISRSDDPASTPLVSTTVGVIAPGDSVQIPVDLPVATLPPNQAVYRMTIDPANVSGDVNTANNSVQFTLGVAGTNANLAGLAVSSGTLVPAFSTLGTSYTVNVPYGVTGVTITPALSDSTASVAIAGGSNLWEGANTATVTVTAQDGVTQTSYALTVNRQFGSRAIVLPPALDFGAVTAGRTASQVLTISNTGNTPLNVSGISFPGGFSGNWSGAIPAGSSQNVTVTFSPTTAASYGGAVSVWSDATAGNGTLAVSGAGVLEANPFAGNYTMVAADPGKNGDKAVTHLPILKGRVAATGYLRIGADGRANAQITIDETGTPTRISCVGACTAAGALGLAGTANVKGTIERISATLLLSVQPGVDGAGTVAWTETRKGKKPATKTLKAVAAAYTPSPVKKGTKLTMSIQEAQKTTIMPLSATATDRATNGAKASVTFNEGTGGFQGTFKDGKGTHSVSGCAFQKLGCFVGTESLGGSNVGNASIRHR